MLPEINQALSAHIKKDVHWLIVGDGSLKSELTKLAPENVTLTGFIEGEELATIYAASDLFVFPSASETFGNVVLEALSCGVRVVGANDGGVRTIVQDMKTGRLAEAKNTTAFTEAIETLLENDQQRIEMSRAGINYAKQQSWESIFANLIDEYREVVGEEIYLEQELA